MLLNRFIRPASQYQTFSTVTSTINQFQESDFRTSISSPSNHSKADLGKFYRHTPEIKKQLFSNGGLPKSFEIQSKTFTESCLMVRKPALELMHYLKSIRPTQSSPRFVIYGKDGVGKSLILAHMLHFGIENDYILVHVPWVADWFKRPKEKANSGIHDGFIDLPIDAATWLVRFKTQNLPLLTRLDLKCSQEYVWSKRETTPVNAPLLQLVEHGIARVKFASEVIAALIGELKQHSSNLKCKTLVAIDGYNAFFYPKTRIVADNKAKITPDKVTLTKPFLNITNHDWCNGACILVVDRLALTDEHMDSELPKYLLNKEGFEHLDPFVPIQVDNYNALEFDRCIDYYLDRKWIQQTGEGFDKELKFLSGSNPYRLMQLCKSL